MTPENVKGLPKFTTSAEKELKHGPSTFRYEAFLWHGADICVQQCLLLLIILFMHFVNFN